MTFKNTNLKINENIEKDNSNFISMMIENENGEYVENNDLKYPMEKYLFNPEKSSCENGGNLSWNKDKNKVEASLLTSDKCYAYFDKYDFTKSCLYGYEDNLACELIKKKDDTLIYHDGSILDDNGKVLDAEDLSYRYSGASNVVNNYICLDGTTIEGKCQTDNDLYRILGLFKNEEEKYEAKLIKADVATIEELGDANAKSVEYPNMPSAYFSESKYYWNSTSGICDSDSDPAYNANVNMWKESNLNKVNLNSFYYNYITNKVKGLANNITKHTWKVTGCLLLNSLIKNINVYELGKFKLTETSNNCYNQGDKNLPRFCNQENDLTYQDEIGLMYISDYVYGTLPEYWNNWAGDYAQSDIKNNNWLYLGKIEWTISRYSFKATSVRLISDSGSASNDDGICYTGFVVRPCFYLSSKIKLASGKGSGDEPYRLAY